MTISNEWRSDFVIQWNDGHPLEQLFFTMVIQWNDGHPVEQFSFNAKESKLDSIVWQAYSPTLALTTPQPVPARSRRIVILVHCSEFVN